MSENKMSLTTFVDFLKQHVKLSPDEAAIVEQLLEAVSYTKGEIILKEGEISTAFYYLIDGCCRMYYLVDGIEKNTFFYSEGQFVSSYESFVQQIPSKHYIACVEDCTMVRITQEHAAHLLGYSSTFGQLSRILMEEELMVYQKILFSFVAMNAEQRYLAFLQDYPELIQRIPLYHIASYLGVNAETLSRIRRRVTQR
jgi:CRP-like cAMP-binding protein